MFKRVGMFEINVSEPSPIWVRISNTVDFGNWSLSLDDVSDLLYALKWAYREGERKLEEIKRLERRPNETSEGSVG